MVSGLGRGRVQGGGGGPVVSSWDCPLEDRKELGFCNSTARERERDRNLALATALPVPREGRTSGLGVGGGAWEGLLGGQDSGSYNKKKIWGIIFGGSTV